MINIKHVMLSIIFIPMWVSGCRFGVENIDDTIWQYLQGNEYGKPSVGLITNQTGKDHAGNRTIDILVARGVDVKRIFAPEHGLSGRVEAAGHVHDEVDAATHIPVMSLYGHGTGKKIGAHQLHDIDVLVFDMQDSGMRHYTYISTLLHCMDGAAQHGKPFVVLDRPNPLGGRMEGPISPKHSKSFIAAAPIPLRHGMTIGELARYFNMHVLEKRAKLHVVPLQNYSRVVAVDDFLAPLSPNILSTAACSGYSFLGLLGEVRPFDTGLGTDNAMQSLALPIKKTLRDAQWKELQAIFKKYQVSSSLRTYHSARKKQDYRGLVFSFSDIAQVPSFDLLVSVLKFFSDAGVHLTFSQYFDTAIGTHKVHDYIRGKLTYGALVGEVNTQLSLFNQQASEAYLYLPAPQMSVSKI